jgi:predicted O-methyltransferase YrrM
MKELAKQFLFNLGWHLTEQARQEQRSMGADLRSLHLLPDLSLESYLPWTEAALRPSAVRVCLNEITIHERKSVIEFGSGISTLMIANHLSHNGGTIVSVENNLEWKRKVQGYLQELNIDQSVCKVVHCPLIANDGYGDKQWYDAKQLQKNIEQRKFDIVIVDGPKACTESTSRARYPALPFITDQLKEDFCIFIDDVKRQGERRVAQKWAEKFNLTLKANIGNSGLGLLRPRNDRSHFGVG